MICLPLGAQTGPGETVNTKPIATSFTKKFEDLVLPKVAANCQMRQPCLHKPFPGTSTPLTSGCSAMPHMNTHQRELSSQPQNQTTTLGLLGLASTKDGWPFTRWELRMNTHPLRFRVQGFRGLGFRISRPGGFRLNMSPYHDVLASNWVLPPSINML